MRSTERPARWLSRWALGLLFVAAGVNHFIRPAMYAAIIPPMLPGPLLLVYLSGAAEVVVGALLLVRRTERLGAWGAIAVLVAIFPANVYMALDAQAFAPIPEVLLWLRLPLQGMLIGWAFIHTRPRGGATLRRS